MNSLDADAINYLISFDHILITMEKNMLFFKEQWSITRLFIECMIPHHQAAIKMCENLLQYTRNYPLQQIAKNIIITQTLGIREMIKIYQTTKEENNSSLDIRNYIYEYLKITKRMIYRMRNSPRTRNIDWNFVNEMIPHHEGAIAMCENLLQYPIDPRLKQVAESIIKKQSQGVMQLERIRSTLARERL